MTNEKIRNGGEQLAKYLPRVYIYRTREDGSSEVTIVPFIRYCSARSLKIIIAMPTMGFTPKFQISASFIAISLLLLTSNAAGYQMFNATSDMCCDGAVQSRNGSATACCGAATYDPSESKCCFGRAVPLPEERGFRHGCCVGVEEANVTAFNFDTHVCCDGVLLEKPDRNASYACHQGELFDAAQSMVCGDAVVAREPGRGCCVAEPFDFENATCCARVEREMTFSGLTTTTSFQLHPKPHPNQGCCGTELYNQTEQVCCDGRPLPRPEGVLLAVCCGGDVITNYTAQICCNGRILERPSENHTCCEDGVYDFRQEVCCGAEVLRKDDGRACCPGAARSFDVNEEFCCQTEVVAIGGANGTEVEGSACCGESTRLRSIGSELDFF